jgi:peroxiredoxin
MFGFFKYRKQYKKWQMEHDADAPKAGDLAPDFTLYDTSGQNPVTLYSFQNIKPVVLVFGSFT